MEYVCCDLCGSDNPVPLFERIDRFSGKTFRYVMCQVCGLIYLNPRPNACELLSYYPSDYEAYRPPDKSTAVARWRKQRALGILRRFVARYHQPGKLLDIGCATGEFLKEMQAHGWEVQGVEISPQAAIIARETYGLKVFIGPLSAFDAQGEIFDIVTMWDVMEHLPSPYAGLLQIHRMLSREGYLIFSVPNLRSFDAQLFGHWWIGWDAPRHLYLFPEPVLKKLLTQTGFEIKEQVCLLGGPGSFQLSWEFWLDQRFGLAVVRRKPLEILSILLPYLLWPYKQFSYALNRGPIVTIVARKAR